MSEELQKQIHELTEQLTAQEKRLQQLNGEASVLLGNLNAAAITTSKLHNTLLEMENKNEKCNKS